MTRTRVVKKPFFLRHRRRKNKLLHNKPFQPSLKLIGNAAACPSGATSRVDSWNYAQFWTILRKLAKDQYSRLFCLFFIDE
jgi:hypothetical protein